MQKTHACGVQTLAAASGVERPARDGEVEPWLDATVCEQVGTAAATAAVGAIYSAACCSLCKRSCARYENTELF